MALIKCESKRSWTAYLPLPDGTVARYEDSGKDALGRIIRLWVMERRAVARLMAMEMELAASAFGAGNA